ncbi:hypothetical protein ERO13_D02G126850v2 [Gossypium hirsutum]|nr:hypothetical protein ERO13_D02G126850v2 [Gossypium hirsutum]
MFKFLFFSFSFHFPIYRLYSLSSNSKSLTLSCLDFLDCRSTSTVKTSTDPPPKQSTLKSIWHTLASFLDFNFYDYG